MLFSNTLTIPTLSTSLEHQLGVSEIVPICSGFDHGVGHPLLLLHDAKAPNCRKNKAFKGLGHYSEWPKVADAVIKAYAVLP